MDNLKAEVDTGGSTLIELDSFWPEGQLRD